MFQAAFVDLDDTLFSSRHKQRGETGLEPAARLRDGQVISHTSAPQRALGRWLGVSDLVVPVTARTEEAFRRVLLPFAGPAVLSHGATVWTDEGRHDTDWAARVDAGLAADVARLAGLHRTLVAHPGGLNVWLAGEPGRPAYLVAKDPARDPERVRAVSEQVVAPWVAAHPGFVHHLNNNNLAVLPPSIGKRAAVAYLIERLRARHGEIFAIGAGDSLTDAPFLSLCHVAVVPTRSQVWDAVRAL